MEEHKKLSPKDLLKLLAFISSILFLIPNIVLLSYYQTEETDNVNANIANTVIISNYASILFFSSFAIRLVIRFLYERKYKQKEDVWYGAIITCICVTSCFTSLLCALYAFVTTCKTLSCYSTTTPLYTLSIIYLHFVFVLGGIFMLFVLATLISFAYICMTDLCENYFCKRDNSWLNRS